MRIAVNAEVEQLGRGLENALDVLSVGGIMAVISYHSGEDRTVKTFFADQQSGGCTCAPELGCVCGAIHRVKVFKASAQLANAHEIATNPRARFGTLAHRSKAHAMSVISFPRRVDTRRRPTRPATSRDTPRRTTHRADAPRRHAATRRWRGTSSSRKSVIVVMVALAISLAGSMFEANRQIEIHSLQSQLLQEQSSYAVQVGSLTNLSAPSQIARKAGALHLVDPTLGLPSPLDVS